MTDPKSIDQTEALGSAPSADSAPESLTLLQKIVKEVKGRPFAYSVLAVSLVAGPILAVMIFPQAPPAAAAIGGLIFGVYGALCAVPQKFM